MFIGLLLLLGAGGLKAQYINTFNVGSGVPADNNTEPLSNYTTPIDATNFFNDNGSQFSWNLGAATAWQYAVYNGWHHTMNFTNLGEMDSTTGFFFDRQVQASGEAANFYNSGTINCGTTIFAIFLNYTTIGLNTVYGGYGAVDVWATNIYNSGQIDVGQSGLAFFTGDNISFVNSSLSIPTSTTTVSNLNFGGLTAPYIYATGQADANTNAWSPSTSLTSTSASGPMNNPAGNSLSLYNSVPYFDIKADATGTNYIVRMIFLQDFSQNTTNNVYFDPGSGNGGAHVEWVGNYTNTADGSPVTTYFYLDDNMLYGGSTNILSYGDPGVGVPGNYTIYATNAQRTFMNPAAQSGFVNGLLPGGTFTNNPYSYMDAQAISTSVPTNNYYYGSVNVTNLPGNVQINAAKTFAISMQSGIGGMNYILIKSTNEFDCDGQETISAPFYDLYLGHTNGSIQLTNVVPEFVPLWNGTVQAWNTRFTNSASGNNYDFRVLLVASQLTPYTSPQTVNFALNSSNNAVISDELNILNSCNVNSTNLLITDNGIGNGANSQYGAVIFETSNTWSSSFPKLRCLTNNGEIETLNGATYGSTATPYLALYNTGEILNLGGSTIYAQDFEDYGYFYAGTSSFQLQSVTATTMLDYIYANGIVSFMASNFVSSYSTILAGKSLTLTVSNQLTDGGYTGNQWSLGTSYTGGSGPGLVLPVKPATGDLLGTTITCTVPTNSSGFGSSVLLNTWAGQNRGVSNAGFSNNAAVGQLVLDALGPAPRAIFSFAGNATNQAIYVDNLVLKDYAANVDTSFNLTNVSFTYTSATNDFIIYYAQATMNGVSVAEKLNHKNNDHLRWVPTYVGYFSSTNIVGPPGVTNLENAALAASSTIDSDGDGLVNSADSTPFFVPQMINFTIGTTSAPPKVVKLTWATPPLATNYVYYTTNLLQPWRPFNAFGSYYWNTNPTVAVTNSAHTNWFISPQAYGNPATNVWVFDTITNMPHFYQIVVQPNLLFQP
jgi:hypothetical protein